VRRPAKSASPQEAGRSQLFNVDEIQQYILFDGKIVQSPTPTGLKLLDAMSK
jgi:hypothetical protein